MDEALILWFMQERENGTPISHNYLLTQALFFNNKIQAKQVEEWTICFRKAKLEFFQTVSSKESMKMLQEDNSNEFERFWNDAMSQADNKKINNDFIKKVYYNY